MSLTERYSHLINPYRVNSLIDISAFDKELAHSHLVAMLRIRTAEKLLADRKRAGQIKGPVHLGVGQEAIAVGMAEHLNEKDFVFGAHRSHSHLLSLNSNFHKLFAEVLGKKTGFSKGMGGSMHLFDGNSGFYGSVPIVAGTVPLGVGAGLAAKMQKKESVAVCYLGDGAMEEGVVHESLNLAAIWKLPVIFVVENNLFASHMHISQRQPHPFTARFAEAHDIPFEVADGNNIGVMSKAAGRACTRARSGEGPSFVEAVTYRWYGHVDWREDIDVGVNRSTEDVNAWRLLDPIKRLHNAMKDQFDWTDEAYHALDIAISNDAERAWKKAETDPYPSEQEMLDNVYEG